MAEKKPSNRERIKEIVTGIEAGIQDLFQSGQFANYLRTMSRFHSYSYNNTVLIHMQMPNATHVAGFNKWKNQFGRHVKKGEKGLTIIAPTPFKKRVEEMKLDPDTRAPVLDHDGNVIMEEREVEIPLFRPVKVFDVSQTEGAPLPSLVASLTGDVQQYEAFMEALRRTSPVPVQFKPLREGLDGFLSLKHQTITIREGMSQVQTVCAAVHEITHAMLHNREQEQLTAAAGNTDQEPPKPKDKNTEEVEAESVSYAVCQYYGIETSANSLGYIATWSKDKTLPELKASLETISKTASVLITSIDRHFQEICKERGIDLTAQQPEQDGPDTVEQFGSDLYDHAQQDTPLDKYPLPDPTFPADELKQNYGYAGGDLLPLSRERAAVLLEQDLTVYMVEAGENPAMVFDRDDLMEQPEGMMFAVSREEWEASQDFRQAVADRMNHQEERERAFLEHGGDCFAIYQLRFGAENLRLHYEPLNIILMQGFTVQRSNYDLSYIAPLSKVNSVDEALARLWNVFNNDPPADYHRPSMSVSDIVAIKKDGVVSCHYCDIVGFVEILDFINRKPTVAELEAQVKAGQTISLTDLADAVHREKKKSVVAQLKGQPTHRQKKTAPKKNTEKER